MKSLVPVHFTIEKPPEGSACTVESSEPCVFVDVVPPFALQFQLAKVFPLALKYVPVPPTIKPSLAKL